MNTKKTEAFTDVRWPLINRICCRVVVTILVLTIVSTFSLTGFSGLSVTPLLLDLTIEPGGSGRGNLYVENTGTEPLTIESQVMGFRTNEKGVALFLTENMSQDYSYSGKKHLSLEPKEIVLEPKQTRVFTYEVKYPMDTEPFGGRYVAALFQASPVEKEANKCEGTNIKVATRVATLILLRPSEEIFAGDQFKEFEVNPSIEQLSAKVVHDGDKLLVSTLLKNLGNLHIRKEEFSGSIEITDESGNVVGDKEISPHIVLPGTEYDLHELWTIPDRLRGDGGKLTLSVTVSVETPYGESVKVEGTTSVEL